LGRPARGSPLYYLYIPQLEVPYSVCSEFTAGFLVFSFGLVIFHIASLPAWTGMLSADSLISGHHVFTPEAEGELPPSGRDIFAFFWAILPRGWKSTQKRKVVPGYVGTALGKDADFGVAYGIMKAIHFWSKNNGETPTTPAYREQNPSATTPVRPTHLVVPGATS